MKLIKIFSIISSISLIFGLDLSGLKSTQEWTSLQNDDVMIKTTNYLGFPICNAETILPFPMKTISSIVENVEEYPNVFIRVSKATSLENDIVHIMLDMPFPFSGRDYIVKYSKYKFGSKWTFKYSAIEHQDAPLQKNHVRLVHAAGEWKLTKINDHETNVSYTWNGELLGDFPNWALDRAWKTQGNEMMEWLNDALQD
jgi:hypothetical protein